MLTICICDSTLPFQVSQPPLNCIEFNNSFLGSMDLYILKPSVISSNFKSPRDDCYSCFHSYIILLIVSFPSKPQWHLVRINLINQIEVHVLLFIKFEPGFFSQRFCKWLGKVSCRMKCFMSITKTNQILHLFLNIRCFGKLIWLTKKILGNRGSRRLKMNNLLSRFMHPHAYNMVDLYYAIVFYR
jgi:hypothetical protein